MASQDGCFSACHACIAHGSSHITRATRGRKDFFWKRECRNDSPFSARQRLKKIGNNPPNSTVIPCVVSQTSIPCSKVGEMVTKSGTWASIFQKYLSRDIYSTSHNKQNGDCALRWFQSRKQSAAMEIAGLDTADRSPGCRRLHRGF